MQPGLCGPEQLLLSARQRPGPALKPLQDRRGTAAALWRPPLGAGRYAAAGGLSPVGSCDRTATFPGDPGPDHLWGDLRPGG